MKIEKSAPDENGRDLVQYRCELCGGIELVRLIRRSRDAADGDSLGDNEAALRS